MDAEATLSTGQREHTVELSFGYPQLVRTKSEAHTRSSSMSSPATGQKSQWFLPQEGIEREVITVDIQIYLGLDALVRPAQV